MMRVVVADDDRATALVAERKLASWGFDVVVTYDGLAAWEAVVADPAPSLLLADWEMPGLDGPSLCRRVRDHAPRAHLYLVLMTARSAVTDVVAGLEAGADDYLIKPVDPAELRARVNVGARVVSLQERLAQKVVELEHSLASVKQLRGLLPICCYCKRVRDDQNYWAAVEVYVTEHSDARFSHGICPTCLPKARAEFGLPAEGRVSR